MKNALTKKYIYLLLVGCVLLGVFLISKYKEGFDNNIKYLDGVDVIYWINLDRSTVRRQKMEKMFKDEVFKGIDIVRVSAVDGKTANIKKILNDNFSNLSNKYTDIEYSCLLSHLNAIKTFNKSDYQNALIMEDDMTLEYKKYWKITIKECASNAPTEWEILQLNYNTSTLPTELYSKTYKNFYSCGVYLINKNGSTKINRIYKKNKIILPHNVIHTADYLLYYLCNAYTYKYPYFMYEAVDSEIHPSHLEHHIYNKNAVTELMRSIN